MAFNRDLQSLYNPLLAKKGSSKYYFQKSVRSFFKTYFIVIRNYRIKSGYHRIKVLVSQNQNCSSFRSAHTLFLLSTYFLNLLFLFAERLVSFESFRIFVVPAPCAAVKEDLKTWEEFMENIGLVLQIFQPYSPMKKCNKV